jgi:hypothetical protein
MYPEICFFSKFKSKATACLQYCKGLWQSLVNLSDASDNTWLVLPHAGIRVSKLVPTVEDFQLDTVFVAAQKLHTVYSEHLCNFLPSHNCIQLKILN